MDLRQLSYFVALFEEGSVTRAAQRVNVVQPALSMQIGRLERELGQKLFDRTPKAMEPTTAGRALYRLTRPILQDLAAAREQMARLSRAPIFGRVSIGVLSSLASSVVPDVLARYGTAHPDVEVSLADGYSTTFIEWVTNRQLDLAIINKPNRKLGLISHHLMNEEMVVVAASGTPLPVAVPIRMQDLPRLKLILPSLRHGLRIELERHLAAEGISIAPMLEFDSPPGLADFVARSDWFTILPSIAVSHRLQDGSLKAYRIVTPRLTRQLVAIHLPDQPMSAAAALLIDELGAALAATSRLVQAHISGADGEDQ
ncbi:MAG TPA: LysR family transcriptional regulator [Acetobacteraceae bacterium]|nr:LysR family transcriptional regulator [Acetobacteraceae bacterium]